MEAAEEAAAAAFASSSLCLASHCFLLEGAGEEAAELLSSGAGEEMDAEETAGNRDMK